MFIYDDFLLDYDGFSLGTFTKQPEKHKRKYVKSGKYSKKNKAAETKQQPALAAQTPQQDAHQLIEAIHYDARKLVQAINNTKDTNEKL